MFEIFNNYYALIAVFTLFIFFIFLFYNYDFKKFKTRKNFLFTYKIVYTDQKETVKKPDVVYGKILYSNKYDLKGKPDYIVKKHFSNKILPVELKSGSVKNGDVPYKGDLMQLTAYFLIIEDLYEKRPPFGYLVYSDFSFKVKNTRKLRKECLNNLKNMRKMLETGNGSAQPSYPKCRYCVCKDTVCKFKIK